MIDSSCLMTSTPNQRSTRQASLTRVATSTSHVLGRFRQARLGRFRQARSPAQTASMQVKHHSDRASYTNGCCCLLLAQRPSNMLVYLRDRYAQTVVRAATLIQKLQIKLSFSPSHSILAPGQPVSALILLRQAPGSVATGVPIFKSLE